MAISYYRGAFYAKLQEESSHFDPLRGYVYRATFKSLSALECQALQSDYVQLGCECELKTSFGVSSLSVIDSTQEFTLDDWQVGKDSYLQDLFSHPTILAILGGFTEDGQFNIGKIRDSLENNEEASAVVTDLTASGYSPDEAATVGRFYSLYQRGTTEFENDTDGSGYVLQHTTNVSNRWQQNISDFNVGQIYSTAELLSEVQDSGLWINPLPPRLAYKIATLPAPPPQGDYFWGWRKSSGTENTSANNRIGIRTNYTLALWSTDLYASFE